MNKRIYIAYHIYEREFKIVSLIKNAILSKYNDVDVVVGTHTPKDIIDYAPDILIIHPLRESYIATMFTCLKVLLNCKIVTMAVEGFYPLDNMDIIDRVIGYNNYPINLIDGMIMWGSKTKSTEGLRMVEKGKIKSLDKIKVIGYPFYEKSAILNDIEYLPHFEKCEDLKTEYKKIIVVTTAFEFSERTVEQHLLEGSFRFYGDKNHIKEYEEEKNKLLTDINRSKKYRDKYLEVIKNLAKRNSDICFIVKLHPQEILAIKENRCNYINKLKEIPNIKLIDFPISIGVFLSYADLLIHYGSTTSLEAYIYTVPTLLLSIENPYDNNMIMSSRYSSKVIDVNEYQKIENYIKNDCVFDRNAVAEKILFESFNWKFGTLYNPLELYADFIVNFDSFHNIYKSDKYFSENIKGRAATNVRFYWIKGIITEGKISKKLSMIKRLNNIYNLDLFASDLQEIFKKILKMVKYE